MSRLDFPRLPLEPPQKPEPTHLCDWCEDDFMPTDLVFQLPNGERVCEACFDEYCADLDRKDRAEQLGVPWDWAGNLYADT